MSRRILVAGIGNIFFGDDAFGVETVRALLRRPQPAGVTVRDFGIRGHNLAFALCDGCDAVILVDATPRGKEPGEVFSLELEMPAPGAQDGTASFGHGLDPVAVLQLAASFGARVGQLFLVGCEPASLEPETGVIGLSAPVQAAVPRAVAMIEALISTLQNDPARTTGQPLATNQEDYAHECR